MNVHFRIMKMNIFEFSIFACFLLMPLSGILKKINGVFSYIDEILLVVFLIASLCYMNRWKSDKVRYKQIRGTIFLICLLYIFTFLANVINNYQYSLSAIFLDAFSWMKFILMVPIGILFFDKKNYKRLYNNLLFASKVIIVWNMVFVVLNQLLKLDLGGKGIRYGIVSYAIPNMHVAFTVGFFAIITSLLLIDYKQNKIWVFCSLIICLSTARFKAFGWIAFMIISFLGMKKRIRFLPLVLAASAIVIIAGESFEAYFIDLSSSRAIELYTAVKIALTNFPFGAGFATFGTTASFTHYSKAYSIFGLSNRYGYMETAGAFIGDGGWSTQIGQFGFWGTAVFVYILYRVFGLYRTVTKNSKNLFPLISILSFIIIASISERIFSGDLAPFLSLALILIYKSYEMGEEL